MTRASSILGDRLEVRLRRRLLPSDLAAADPGFSYLEKAKESGSVRVVKSARRPRIEWVSVSENRMYSILGRMNAHRGPNEVAACYAKMGRAAPPTEGVYEDFLDLFVAEAKSLKVGDPRDPQTMIPPRSAPPGAPSSTAASCPQGTKGRAFSATEPYFQPTIIADVTPSMPVFQEELFGPVASVIKA